MLTQQAFKVCLAKDLSADLPKGRSAGISLCDLAWKFFWASATTCRSNLTQRHRDAKRCRRSGHL